MPPIHLSPPEHNLEDQRHIRWFLRGCMRICSIPALLLMSSFIGFTGLAIESGITVVQAVFMTLTIWACRSSRRRAVVGAFDAYGGCTASRIAGSEDPETDASGLVSFRGCHRVGHGHGRVAQDTA